MTLLRQIPASYASARYAQLKKAGGLCACGRTSAGANCASAAKVEYREVYDLGHHME